jgi:hypothetical protein
MSIKGFRSLNPAPNLVIQVVRVRESPPQHIFNGLTITTQSVLLWNLENVYFILLGAYRFEGTNRIRDIIGNLLKNMITTSWFLEAPVVKW